MSGGFTEGLHRGITLHTVNQRGPRGHSRLNRGHRVVEGVTSFKRGLYSGWKES